MKKTFLTLVAVGFGVSVAFAQTTATDPAQEETPQQNTEATTEYNQGQPADQMYSQKEGRKKVEKSELPQEVQDALNNGQYSEWEVLTIYEVSPDATEQPAEGVEPQAVVYEVEVASATEQPGDMQTTEEGMEGLETEQVSERQPDMVLFFDQAGELIKEEAPEDKFQEKE